MPRYRPAGREAGTAFTGIRTFMRLPTAADLDGVDLAIIGLPFDTGGTFAVGCRFAPEAIRSASALLRPYHPEHGIDLFEHISAIDYGDVSITPGYTEESLEKISQAIYDLAARNIIPISFGGDHTVALGELRGIAQAIRAPVSLILFDSHPDTYPDFRGHPYAHSTPFRRAVEEGILSPETSLLCGLRGPMFGPADISEALGMGFQILTSRDMHQMTSEQIAAAIKERLKSTPCFLSFDVDFLDPAFAPGTGTPEIGGFSTWRAQDILRRLGGINLVAADVVEVLPAYDPTRITALAAANIAYEIISLAALGQRSKGSDHV